MKKRYWLLFIFVFVITFSTYYIIYNNLQPRNEKNIEHVENSIDEKEEEIEEIPEPRISNISLLATGDIMFHSPQSRAAYDDSRKTYDFSNSFKYVKKYIESTNLSLGNFETVTAGMDIGIKGFPRFNTPKESLLAIKEAGFDILSTANNHSLDQGKKGIIATIDAIKEYNMKNIGTYKDRNREILIEEIDGISLGFLSYTYGMNGLDSLLSSDELEYMIDTIDEVKIKEDIERLKNEEIDMIIVFIHWGNEYQREPSQEQRLLAKNMVEWGANIILGSHPHVIQTTEMINHNGRENFIIYSMGNFLSNQRKETMGNSYTEDGIMVQIEIEKDFSKDSPVIKTIDYIPTWVYRYRNNGRLYYEILPIDDILQGRLDMALPKEILNRIEKSYNDTMNTIKGTKN